MKKITITIEGMHCASCAGNVERSLRKVKGVKSVNISVMTHKGFVEADDSFSKKEMKEAISRAGFKAVKIEEE